MNIRQFEQNESHYIEIKVKYKRFQGDRIEVADGGS